MDGNKDEARKCLRIGKEALDSGDRSRALKFLTKARRLDPTLAIDHLLSSAGGGGSGVTDDGGVADDAGVATRSEPEKAGEASSASASATLRARIRSSVPLENGSSEAYTEEQITIVRQVKKKKDYYEILGLERSCTVEDVRKAYRKLSLKVHPDKNKAPGAEEAFKAVSKAFQCLSNEENRKRYDVSGTDEPALVKRHHHSHAHGFNGFYDADVDAEEIFRNFFFGGMHPAATTPFGGFQFRTGGMGGTGVHGTQGSGNFNIRALLQILPVIILLLFNFLPSSDPLYTFSRSYPYEHKVLTSKGAPFYVKSAKFEQDYPYQSSARIDLERRIEREYVGLLAQNCRLELQRQHWGLQQQKPYCDMLQKFQEGEAA